MNCPRCAQPMRAYRLDGHLGHDVEIDVCAPCQSIWFDAQESLQLTPGAILAVFRVVGENVTRPAMRDGDIMRCPRCHGQLRRTQDLQHNTHFEYFRCPNQHGRLIAFFDFLKEKDFVKPLMPQQIAELRKYVQTVNCSNCGAPVDLARHSQCTHCGSPLSILDIGQAERLVAQLHAAGDRSTKPVDPDLPLALARARRETDAAFAGMPGHPDWGHEEWSLGTVGAGLSALMRLMQK
ncbi:MAG: zf-TFIIB domain-containing protein [Acidobacteriota bacterium]